LWYKRLVYHSSCDAYCIIVGYPHIADQISSILWLMHSDLHEPKFSRAFECLSTMVASVQPEVVDSAYGEERMGNVSFLEHNYSKAKFHVRLKRRNGRVKHLVRLLVIWCSKLQLILNTTLKNLDCNYTFLCSMRSYMSRDMM
jgi:hypothetical protein